MKRLLFYLAVLMCLRDAARADGCFIVTADKRDISEPTQKALLVHSSGVEDLILQVRYAGATESFAWIVPTPGRPQIGECRDDLFYALAVFTNPVAKQGFGGGEASGVQLVERKQVGVYDVSVLEAEDAAALGQWLNSHNYAVAPRMAPVFDYYIRRGWRFTAIRIDLQKAGEGDAEKVKKLLTQGELAPLHLTFRTSLPVYPLKISSLNGGTTDLLLYLVTDSPVFSQGLKTEYSRKLPMETLNGLTRNQPTLSHAMWLTKLSRTLPTAAMTGDLTFAFRIATE